MNAVKEYLQDAKQSVSVTGALLDNIDRPSHLTKIIVLVTVALIGAGTAFLLAAFKHGEDYSLYSAFSFCLAFLFGLAPLTSTWLLIKRRLNIFEFHRVRDQTIRLETEVFDYSELEPTSSHRSGRLQSTVHNHETIVRALELLYSRSEPSNTAPTTIDDCLLKMMIFGLRSKHEQVIELAEKYLEVDYNIDSNPRFHSRQAYAWLNLGEFEEANTSINKAISLVVNQNTSQDASGANGKRLRYLFHRLRINLECAEHHHRFIERGSLEHCAYFETALSNAKSDLQTLSGSAKWHLETKKLRQYNMFKHQLLNSLEPQNADR